MRSSAVGKPTLAAAAGSRPASHGGAKDGAIHAAGKRDRGGESDSSSDVSDGDDGGRVAVDERRVADGASSSDSAGVIDTDDDSEVELSNTKFVKSVEKVKGKIAPVMQTLPAVSMGSTSAAPPRGVEVLMAKAPSRKRSHATDLVAELSKRAAVNVGLGHGAGWD